MSVNDELINSLNDEELDAVADMLSDEQIVSAIRRRCVNVGDVFDNDNVLEYVNGAFDIDDVFTCSEIADYVKDNFYISDIYYEDTIMEYARCNLNLYDREDIEEAFEDPSGVYRTSRLEEWASDNGFFKHGERKRGKVLQIMKEDK